MDESHENRQMIGINGLDKQYLWQGLCNGLGPAYNLQTVLCSFHWSHLVRETGSFSWSQLCLHSHIPRHLHTYTHCSCTSRSTQWAMVPAELGEKKKKWPIVFFLCVSVRVPCFCFSCVPNPSPRSLLLAVWTPSWGRVTCSLLAWQSASLSRPAVSTCWRLTANRLEWNQPTAEIDFVWDAIDDNCCIQL